MGPRTDFMVRQSFLFGFQSAREVLFLPEVSLSISLSFFKACTYVWLHWVLQHSGSSCRAWASF